MAKSKKDFTEAAKKTFTPDTATLQYLSSAERRDYTYRERRNHRLQLLMTETLYSKLSARAAEDGRSVNDLVNAILENELK